jgi:hypothetical protein
VPAASLAIDTSPRAGLIDNDGGHRDRALRYPSLGGVRLSAPLTSTVVDAAATSSVASSPCWSAARSATLDFFSRPGSPLQGICKRGQTRRPYQSDGGVIFEGHRLHFTANVAAPNHVEVWWQVANTGRHARSVGGLRGEIFHGRDVNGNALSNQMENWESARSG